jgi:hypothetical protein
MELADAQKTLRLHFLNGATGVLTSGAVWLLGAAVTYYVSFLTGIISFFIAGMFIYPISALAAKVLVKETVEPDKVLMRIGVLSLPLLFGGLFLGYVSSIDNPALFFPIVSVAIGLRYVTFIRMYGLKLLYGSLAGALILVGVIGWVTGAIPPAIAALTTGIIEALFGLMLLRPKT